MKQKIKYNLLRTSIYTVLLLVLLNVTSSLSSAKKVINSLENFLPTNNEVFPWEKNEPAILYEQRQLYEYINGGAEIFHEYGFNRVLTQSYMYNDELIIVDIYEMENTKAAFGIYSIQRDPNMPTLDFGDDCTQSDFHVAFWQDCFYVVIIGDKSDITTKKILINFAQSISKHIGKTSMQPEIIDHLPKHNILPGSAGYLKGLLGLNTQLYLGQKNILGINGDKVEGAFAIYQINNDKAHLLLIRYPDLKEANAKASLVKEFFSKKYESNSQYNHSIFIDSKGLQYSILVINNFLYIFFRSTSFDLIQKVIKQKNYSFEN